ncbi:MAG: aspartate aminotransferase family protein, partial [Actinobacteria bacterium]
MVRELIASGAGREYDLYAKTINPQFVRVLRTIGFDRRWVRAQGAYLEDAAGRRFLDMLGGFG